MGMGCQFEPADYLPSLPIKAQIFLGPYVFCIRGFSNTHILTLLSD